MMRLDLQSLEVRFLLRLLLSVQSHPIVFLDCHLVDLFVTVLS